MSLQKLKQTLNYILNVTEECAIVDAAESAIVHLEKAEKEMQPAAELDVKKELQNMQAVCLDNLSWDDLSDLRAKVQDLWDKADDLANAYSTIAQEIDAFEDEIESVMDSRDGEDDEGEGDSSEEESDSDGDE